MKSESKRKLWMYCLWNATMLLLIVVLELSISGVNYKSNLVDDYEYDPSGLEWNFVGQTEERVYASTTAQLAHNLFINLWILNLVFGFIVDSVPNALSRFFKITLSENRTLLFKRYSRIVLVSTPIVVVLQIIVHLFF
jgi:hypothetical protein